MILRRITEHVKAQNWFAVGLDFLIVVAGILLAFQITSWNDARAERRTESLLLGYLAEDLRDDLAQIERARITAEWRMSALDVALRDATGEATPKLLMTETGAEQVDPIAPFEADAPHAINKAMTLTRLLDANRSTYAAMISTGEIDTIRDGELVREIQQYYARVDLVNNFETRLIAMREKLLDAQIDAGFSFEETSAPDRIIGLIREREPLRAATRGYWSFTNDHRNLLADMDDRADRLLGQLEQEIGQ